MSENSLLNALGLYEKRIIFEYVKHTAANERASLSETEMYAIAKTAGVPAALTKVALNRICANNLLDCTFDDHSDEYWYVIHKDFYDEATALYGVEELEALQRRKSIPASDRFVALDHNLPALVEAKQAVESLSKAISSSNSLFANAEERIQVSEELNFLGAIISKPKIHVAAVWDYTKNNQTLKSLAEQVKSEIVKQAAVLLFQNLEKLLIFLMSSL